MAGGWGNPLDRDPEGVKFNAVEGLLSFKRARDVYGVVLMQKDAENPETIDIDHKATEALRKKLKTSGGNSEKPSHRNLKRQTQTRHW